MSVKKNEQQYWNLPNALTVLRLLLVPVYIAVFLVGSKYRALAVFVVACLTDFLDGRIARRFQLITNFGKLMDPLADKIMVLTAMFSMAIGNPPFIQPVIPWSAVIILLLKECIMIWGGLKLYSHGIVTHSSPIGKVAQVVFVFALIATYFHDQLAAVLPHWFMAPDILLLWIAVALTLSALLYYVISSLRNAAAMGIIGQGKREG